MIISYLKSNVKGLVISVFILGVMSLLLFLNEVPTQEIAYGALVWTFLALVLYGYDFFKFRKKLQQLKQLENSIQFELPEFPEAENLLEREYQELLALLYDSKMESCNEFELRRRDMTEYYSMWVHQIKTPIAAMRLVLQNCENEAAWRSETAWCSENAIQRETTGQQEAAGQQVTTGQRETAGQQETAKLLEEELFQIEQYVEMALQYLRLDSVSTDFVLKEEALDGIVREAIRKYAKLFIRKKVSVRYEGIEEKVVTDEKWLAFVVEQVLSNAIKYTMQGSISIYFEEDGEGGSLIIEDTGIGIRAEDLPRVFEKGYTGYNGRVNKTSSGIGLYLCHEVLKKLSHTIEITSEVGKGTRVKIGFLQECKKTRENVS